MIRDLKRDYAVHGQEDAIREFVTSFHSKVYDADFRSSNNTYQKFFDNVRGGWSEKLIRLRREILKDEFLAKHPLPELDIHRQISEEEKICVFGRRQECDRCGCPLRDYKSAEYHHKIRHTDGGKSEIENIMILCTECHDAIHRNEDDTGVWFSNGL